MRLLLIRHGETVDNVAGNYAGTTDSPLTNHGVLQANRLGAHLAATGIKTACIFSSDLQRAFKTAEAIRIAQDPNAKPVIQLPLLREQDFGFYEGKRYFERAKDSNKNGKDVNLAAQRNEPGFVDVESKESMRMRANMFVDEHLLGQLKEFPDDQAVVVVAHGIILTHLWRSVLRRFQPEKVTMTAGVEGIDRGLEYLGGWSNTGYLDLEIVSIDSKSAPDDPTKSVGKGKPIALSEPPPKDSVIPLDFASAPVAQPPSPKSPQVNTPKLLKKTLVVKAVNSVEHLKGLKKTRGGIGSLKHDSKQKTMDSFFKKRKLE